MRRHLPLAVPASAFGAENALENASFRVGKHAFSHPFASGRLGFRPETPVKALALVAHLAQQRGAGKARTICGRKVIAALRRIGRAQHVDP